MSRNLHKLVSGKFRNFQRPISNHFGNIPKKHEVWAESIPLTDTEQSFSSLWCGAYARDVNIFCWGLHEFRPNNEHTRGICNQKFYIPKGAFKQLQCLDWIVSNVWAYDIHMLKRSLLGAHWMGGSFIHLPNYLTALDLAGSSFNGMPCQSAR